MQSKKTEQSIKRTILYYPTINIPTNSWLRSSLLYWDEVSSIIPQDYNNNSLISLSKDIEYLMKEELFRPIRPDQLLHNTNNWDILNDFRTEFIDTVNSTEFEELLKKSRIRTRRIHENKISSKDIIRKGGRIHHDKISQDIFYFLKEKKLAVNDSHYSSWVLFEGNTALLYMSLLAKYIALTDKEHTVIGTDQRIYERLNFKPANVGQGTPVISCDFKRLLPSPSNHVLIKDIIKFKRKRGQNLAAFRKILFDTEKKLSNANSNPEIKEIIVAFQEELKKGLNDMTAIYKDAKIDFIFKSVKSLINWKSSTLVTGLAVTLNEKYKVTEMPMWLSGLAIAAAGAIDISSAYIETRNKRKAEERKLPFSYLYHAQRAGIVPFIK